MKYAISGHEGKTAVEEVILSLLPGVPLQRVEAAALDGDWLLSQMRREGRESVLRSRACLGGRVTEDERRVTDGPDPQENRRRLTHELKLSVYAVLRPFLAEDPPWGSMTGVRPGKLARRLLEEGRGEEEAARILQNRYFVTPRRSQLALAAARCARQIGQTLEPGQVAVYAGIPFCPSRCSYCSFVSQAVEQARALVEPYVDTLCREIRLTGDMLRQLGTQVTSLYVGGGTPTTLSASLLEGVLEELARQFASPALREFTVEAGRPDTIDEDKLRRMRACGVDRISINPQSMNPAVLQAIGRSHTPEQVLSSYALARRVGFENINMDVIAGLPGDEEESFAQTMRTLLSLQPENITVHTLAAKKGAAKGDKRPSPGQIARVRGMVDRSIALLTAAGYRPYYLYRQKYMAGGLENVGWCRADMVNEYNVVMMEEIQSVISLGAGGVTKLVDPRTGAVRRFANSKYPFEYHRELDKIQRSKEQIADGLRQLWGRPEE